MAIDQGRQQFEEIQRLEAIGRIAKLVQQYNLTAQDLLPIVLKAGQKLLAEPSSVRAEAFDPYFDAR